MGRFTDNRGNDWVVEVTVSTIKRVRSLTDVDLLDTEGGQILKDLASDPILLADVLYAVCKPQADERDISDEEFGEGLAGDAIANATDALLEALSDFFPGRRAELLKTALQKMDQMEETYLDQVEEKINDPALMDQMQESLEGMFGETSTGSQDSSE